ncbi:MAG: DUF192 domain-containing protein [Phycisphaerae bacterium]|jgi:hypothetical protein
MAARENLTTHTALATILAVSLTLPSCGQNSPATPAKPAEKPAETKPAETKPADAQPADAKPAETKPADAKPTETKPVEPAIDDAAWPQPANPIGSLESMDVKLGGKTFSLEKAVTNQTRFGGLSGRRSIPESGGMIFIFSYPMLMQFVMRDCPIPIDIIYVDAGGRITAMYNMKPEAPRGEGEKDLNPLNGTNSKYESRLRKYSSRFDSLIAIELKGGTLNIDGSNPGGIELKVGQKLDLDMQALRKLAK